MSGPEERYEDRCIWKEEKRIESSIDDYELSEDEERGEDR